ncbi:MULTISPECIES: nitrite reductase small subunit NirD [Vibrio]|uniref:Nitrite reductase (NADH) small subunit n=1 Tax=Vibrio ruber (strain DSM 16370 / JCM 11486 / BCRC 17186 / CECT 7878 / LMG 23124 / VR1) TaxID=1123498 RepID=A0A1R4LRU0_VIBR1|nr:MULTISPECIES: nitrite reductase small subunit NirD [Vibrio]KUI99643.1 nirD protein [Vibrio sp. MEBiC08052]SJN59235.1 Nitrite reductase (NADH) small subunit [Vibrio ruber DSM 16370]
MSQWQKICEVNAIIPGTGVCALVNQTQVALFRPYADERVFAIDNYDPIAQANVLSRGIICEHLAELWVASPVKKQRFNLSDGRCLEDEQFNIRAYDVRVVDHTIEVLTT